MGYFKSINFNNFRNFSNISVDFDSSCNVIYGKNGVGKTNILEAISLFEKGRGFKKEKINYLSNFNNKNDNKFIVSSAFIKEDIILKAQVYNSSANLKRILINGSDDRESIKYFESLFSIIYFLPEMERLFVSSPSLRRNFLDRLVFNYNKNYNIIINKYKKLIYERQSLLKNIKYDENWINQIENNICEEGLKIYKMRVAHINNINKILGDIDLANHFSYGFFLKLDDEFWYKDLQEKEDKNKYLLRLQQIRKNDTYVGGCSIGPHRSDLLSININNNFNLSHLSTGQQKTMILLIIISQCKFLINNLQFKPVILLDEICSHLDDVNRELLLYLVNELKIQVFMTGTEKSFFSFLSTKANYCNIT